MQHSGSEKDRGIVDKIEMRRNRDGLPPRWSISNCVICGFVIAVSRSSDALLCITKMRKVLHNYHVGLDAKVHGNMQRLPNCGPFPNCRTAYQLRYRSCDKAVETLSLPVKALCTLQPRADSNENDVVRILLSDCTFFLQYIRNST